MFPPSAWRDEGVETLIHIFSRETIQLSLLGKAKCPKGKIAVYEEAVKNN